MRTLGSKYEVLTLTRALLWNGALGSYSVSWAYSLGTGCQFCEAVQKSRSRTLPVIASNPVSGESDT
jgi:hypothetical protein